MRRKRHSEEAEPLQMSVLELLLEVDEEGEKGRWGQVRGQPARGGPSRWKIPWRRKWQPTPVLLPGKFYGQRGLVGYSLWGHKKWNSTERLRTHDCSGNPCPASHHSLPTSPSRQLGHLLCSIKDTTKDCEYSVFLELLLNWMRRGLSPCPFYR